jgi:hypothetical protein
MDSVSGPAKVIHGHVSEGTNCALSTTWTYSSRELLPVIGVTIWLRCLLGLVLASEDCPYLWQPHEPV